jgi:ATP-dependent RNA helicase DeaD
MITALSDALAERGYDALTDVQQAVTAPELDGADLLVSAQTGSGKTVGFGLAIAPTLMQGGAELGPAAAPLALIVAPTRELAMQVMRELQWLYAKTGARVVSCVGGMDTRTERRALERGAHIVVGTPGRLRDHITRGALVLDDLRVVVLDEADEMLDLGFREDLEFMLDAAPDTRRTLMFSATVPPQIAKLAQQFQRDAVRVATVSGKSQHSDISYQALRVAAQDTENAIFNLLRFHDAENAIVFGNTRAAVNHLTARLANRGFSVVCLSGELSQTERTHALQAMRDGRARVCVATDVAARGIDLPGLELVIHADLPSNAEGLLHRSGRTGRAGRKGISALIIPPKLVKKAERLLRFAKIQAEWTTAPDADAIRARDEDRLLNDPVWSEPATEEETAFAARLLAAQSPEQIAAGYLRLFRTRLSAPEDLSAPDAAPTRRDPKSFGPSRWFRLSVGRKDRAEPRWLLPLLCRGADLDKDHIGAIRVQYDETFVELSEAGAAGLGDWLTQGGTLEKGVTMTAMAGAPDLSPQRPRPADAPRPDRPRHDRPRDDKPRPDKSHHDKPRTDKPNRKPKYDPAPNPERKQQDTVPSSQASPEDIADAVSARKPRQAKPGRTDAPARDKPGKPKPGPRGAAPKPKPHAKPHRADAPSSAPRGKPPANASDPSKRMERPGKPGGKPAGKPGGKPPQKRGGDQPPRRGKGRP